MEGIQDVNNTPHRRALEEEARYIERRSAKKMFIKGAKEGLILGLVSAVTVFFLLFGIVEFIMSLLNIEQLPWWVQYLIWGISLLPSYKAGKRVGYDYWFQQGRITLDLAEVGIPLRFGQRAQGHKEFFDAVSKLHGATQRSEDVGDMEDLISFVEKNRKRFWILDEGDTWWRPGPFGGVEPVNVRENMIGVPLLKELSSTGMPVFADVDLQTKVYNPFRYVELEDPEGSKISMMKAAVRKYCLQFPIYFLTTYYGPMALWLSGHHHESREKSQEAFEREIGKYNKKRSAILGDDEGSLQAIEVPESLLEPDEGDPVIVLRRWGVVIFNTFIHDVDPPEDLLREDTESASLRRQAQTTKDLIDTYYLPAVGGKNRELAADLLMLDTGKNIKRISLQAGEAGSLEKAATLFGESGGGSSEKKEG